MCERESCIMSFVPLEGTAYSLREMASNDCFCDELKTPKAALESLFYSDANCFPMSVKFARCHKCSFTYQ